MPKAKTNGEVGVRITLQNGWVRMRPMTVDDLLALADVERDFPAAIRCVKAAVLESGFANGKDLGAQPVAVYTEVLKKWNQTEDEGALPPASAPPSASPS